MTFRSRKQATLYTNRVHCIGNVSYIGRHIGGVESRLHQCADVCANCHGLASWCVWCEQL